uniref:Skp1-related protein n=1 Tax=Panagrolaimus sp. ES5 TaxID=591445 RepID=A0AC34G8K0_9BILA
MADVSVSIEDQYESNFNLISSDDIQGSSSTSKAEEKMEIPVKDVTSKVLQKVIEFCKHYESAEPYIPPSGPNACVSTPPEDHWDIVFLKKLSSPELHEVICAANYLNISRLIDACCYRLGYMIQGRTVEEIRRIFQIKNDFTKEEEENLRKEHLWYSELEK